MKQSSSAVYLIWLRAAGSAAHTATMARPPPPHPWKTGAFSGTPGDQEKRQPRQPELVWFYPLFRCHCQELWGWEVTCPQRGVAPPTRDSAPPFTATALSPELLCAPPRF